jgi:hypothetical protein
MAELTVTDGLSDIIGEQDPVGLNDSTYTQIGWFSCINRRGLAGVQLLVDGAALTSLKITRSMKVGGHTAGSQKDVLVDTDFNTATEFLRECLPASPHTAADGTRIQLKIDVSGAAEIGIYAKSDGANLVVESITLP